MTLTHKWKYTIFVVRWHKQVIFLEVSFLEMHLNLTTDGKNCLIWKKNAPFNVPLTLSCHLLPVAEFLLFLFSPTLALTMITGLPLLLYVSSAGSLYWLHICYGNVCREKWNEMEYEFKYFHFWNWVDLAICYTFRDRAVEICSCTVMAIHYCNLSPHF